MRFRTVTVSIILSLFVSRPLFAAPQCQVLLSAVGSELSPGEAPVLLAADWLSQQSLDLDPKRTHLAELRPMVTQLLEQTKQLLTSKRQARFAAARMTQLEGIIKETEARLRSNLTYEYLFLLPFRMAAFLDMENPDPIAASLSRPGEIEASYRLEDFATHERFLQLLEKISQQSQLPINRNRPHQLLEVYKKLRKFPNAIFLPMAGLSSYPGLNRMSAKGVWPLGLIAERAIIDGDFHTPLEALLHDLVHASDSYFIEEGQPGSYFRWAFEMDNELVRRIDASNFSLQQKTFLHYVHYRLYHEADRGEITEMLNEVDSGEAGQLSAVELQHAFELLLSGRVREEIDRGLRVDSSAVKSEFLALLPSTSAVEARRFFLDSIKLYQRDVLPGAAQSVWRRLGSRKK